MRIDFPQDFLWGASTSSYQIEGAWDEDGRGLSIWDTFSHTPGKVANDDTGDVACDHYHRYREDLRLMADLGLGVYRFSTAWPRLFPSGSGSPNLKGRDFYDRLIDSVLEVGITPWLCPYHWDLPQALQDKGGWGNRDIVHYFNDYVGYLGESYSDRVKTFVILNEPNVIAILGHLFGLHAPGARDLNLTVAVTHHLNLAQGMALKRLRESRGDLLLGTVLNLQPVHPAREREEDIQAAKLFDVLWNRNYLEPLFKGHYPRFSETMMEPYLRTGDMELIKQPLDLLGLNLYTRFMMQADNSTLGVGQAALPKGAETTDMGWEVYPDALYEQLLDLRDNYGNPDVYVTENGAAFPDELNPQGQIVDTRRVRFLEDYLFAAKRALDEGANLKGYFVWSLLDNFEWHEGYGKRFGIVHVDYGSLARTPKSSYRWFADLIRDGSFNLADERLEPRDQDPY